MDERLLSQSHQQYEDSEEWSLRPQKFEQYIGQESLSKIVNLQLIFKCYGLYWLLFQFLHIWIGHENMFVCF